MVEITTSTHAKRTHQPRKRGIRRCGAGQLVQQHQPADLLVGNHWLSRNRKKFTQNLSQAKLGVEGRGYRDPPLYMRPKGSRDIETE